jgi:hypothetical protein
MVDLVVIMFGLTKLIVFKWSGKLSDETLLVKV